jgi:AraC-like DNA-binding protein
MLSITTPGFIFSKSEIYHFIPAALIALLNIPYLFASADEKANFVTQGNGMLNNAMFEYLIAIYMVGIFGIFTFQLIVYSIKAFALYKKYKTYIENRFSYTENINIDWILLLLICFVIFFVFNDILYLVGFRQNYITQVMYNLAMLSITFYVGYRGLLQKDINENITSNRPVIISHNTKNEATTPVNQLVSDYHEVNNNEEFGSGSKPQKVESFKKYSGSTLSEDQKISLISKLEHLIQVEKIFINEKLSIEDIAIKLDTNSKYISQIINETFNKNFYNYINSYRIEEAKRMLRSELSDKYSILGIAQSVGFVSKSTFNVAFKRITGLTPTEFKTMNTRVQEKS